MEALFLAVSEFCMSAEHDLQMPGQVFFGEEIGDAGGAGTFIGGNLEEWRILASDFRYGDVAQEADQLAREMGGAVTF